jgi:hypothetical protein
VYRLIKLLLMKSLGIEIQDINMMVSGRENVEQ